MINRLSYLTTLASCLFATVLVAQPAVFDFPSGCTQATLNGRTFLIEVQLDGGSPELNSDWVAVCNASNDVVGRAIVENIFSNGMIVTGAQLVLREAQGATSCSALYTDGPLTVKFWDASTGDVLLAGNSIFTAVNDGGTIDGPDGDGATNDLFDFLAASLPVALSDFTATANEGTVKLDWSTATESNNSYFEVQHSTDPATGFEKIGTVAGNETTTSTSNYDFTDLNPGEGTVYYRLNQVDVTGTSAYSPIVVVELEVSAEREVAVFPNPTASGSRLTVRLNGPWTNGNANIQLLDAAGRNVANWSGLSNGSLNTTLPVLRSGVYQLVVTDGEERRITRVVVR